MKKDRGAGDKRPAIFATPGKAPGKAPGQGRITGPALSDFGVSMALGQIGFDAPRTASPFVAPVLVPAPARKPAPADGSTDTALRRRDWLLDVAERQRALSPLTGGVARVRDLPGEAFLDHFYAPGRPVVIEGALADWPALALWTPAYLRETVGSAPVEYQGGRDGRPDFELHKDNHKKVGAFNAFIDRITTEGAGNDSYITAYNSGTNRAAFAPLEKDVRPIDAYLTPESGMLWIGPAGTFTPLHFDLTNNLLAQVTGRKRLVLVPPSETRHLAHRRHVFSDVHDITGADHLARHPAAGRARYFEVDLNPGDLLYIPVGWWHQVRSLDFSVMLTYTSFLWPNDAYATYPGD